jgi:zinc protease
MKSPNRKIQPAILPVSISKIPEVETYYLDNKVPVFIINSGSEEIMKLEIFFRAGQIEEQIPLLASTVNMMLVESSENYTAEELNKTIDFYGTFINLNLDKDSAGITVFFLNKHLEKILELCNEILFRPAFLEAELDTLLKKRLQWYMVNKQKVQNLASDKFFESLFGNRHPYGRQIEKIDFERITTSDLRTFHNDFYNPLKMAIFVSGKIHPDTNLQLNSYFGKIPGKKTVIAGSDTIFEGEKNKKVFIRKKGAIQTAVRIGSTTINKRHPDYHGLKILDTVLGGYFGSRLMKNIREDKGYTYGISSSVASFNYSGYKIIGAEVGKKYIKKTLHEIYKEIKKLQDSPVENDELEVVRSFMTGEMVRMFDGPFALSDSFRSAWEFGLDNSYYYDLAGKIKTIGPDEIIHLARTYYNIDDLYEIVAGEE